MTVKRQSAEKFSYEYTMNSWNSVFTEPDQSPVHMRPDLYCLTHFYHFTIYGAVHLCTTNFVQVHKIQIRKVSFVQISYSSCRNASFDQRNLTSKPILLKLKTEWVYFFSLPKLAFWAPDCHIWHYCTWSHQQLLLLWEREKPLLRVRNARKWSQLTMANNPQDGYPK